MRPVVRLLGISVVAAATVTCADHSTGVSGIRRANLPIAPRFTAAPEGGPSIEIARIQGVLRNASNGDSAFAEALVAGDSAVLRFSDVRVIGDSTTYLLDVRALDPADIPVFSGSQEVRIKPGDNAPAAPELEYTAPDAAVTSIEIRAGGEAITQLALEWAGAAAGDQSCVNREPSQSAVTQQQLTVTGTTAEGGPVNNVLVGWTSLDTSVATVDANGLLQARCSNKSVLVLARTYLDRRDTIEVAVHAPPFTLMLSPDSVALPLDESVVLHAAVVDENGNAVSADEVSWQTSDAGRASVVANGAEATVTGIATGRVIITASSGDKTTVGIVQVVSPAASAVVISPAFDTLAVGQAKVLDVTAYDANGEPIPDASGFEWISTNTGVLAVDASRGRSTTITALSPGSADVEVWLNGRADTAHVSVYQATDGRISGRVVDGSSFAPLSGVAIDGPGSTIATDAAGTFTSSPLTPPVTLQFSKTGFVAFNFYNPPIQLGQVASVGDLPMAPSSAGLGVLSGTVINALDDAPVAGASVLLYPGVNPPSADPTNNASSPAAVASTSSDATGAFVLHDVAPGTYTYAISAPGFSLARSVTVSIADQVRDARIVLSPQVSGNALRIVLTWGDCSLNGDVPCDLDSHLTGPATPPDTGRFHIAYFSPEYASATDVIAMLDNDATGGLGPETITLQPKTAGLFRYYVHNYSDSFDTTSVRLSQTSQARVEVYQGTKLLATFLPPAGSMGTVWAVFTFDGANIRTVGQIYRLQDFTDLPPDLSAGARSAGDPQRVIEDARTHTKIRRR